MTAAAKAQHQDQQNETFTTRRATVPALEALLEQPLNVLDHGFIRVVDYMGDDSAIVQAARVSYGKGTKKVSQDRGLIHYLVRHRHTTPLEMCEIKLHVKAPLFVARHWLRHRTASVNEYSARYSVLNKEFYLPAPDQVAAQSTVNNQGRGKVLSPEQAAHVLELIKADSLRTYDTYQYLLNEDDKQQVVDEERDGLARELARMNLTVNYYTEWYWKIDLHNLFHFIKLRADSHAQYEIRVYAERMLEVVKAWVPFAYEAFEEYVQGAGHLSKSGLVAVKAMLAGKSVTQESSGMSAREWREFCALLELPENAA